MQVGSTQRVLSSLRHYLIQSTKAATASSSSLSSSSIQSDSFHSTPINSEKWKNKWKFETPREKPTKNYIRYVTRQRRADAKKALNDLLSNYGSSKMTFEELDEQIDQSARSGKKGRLKNSARCTNKDYKKPKRRFRRENFSEDFDGHPENVFQARFGEKWYTWSFKSWNESHYQNSTAGFSWRQYSWTNGSNEEWGTGNEFDSDNESCVIGSSIDRKTLGLAPKGPLKIEDVKNAFRLSALKWHPDKHQGPSQAIAEEKFKLCANAYKSLCDAFAAAA